jgi:HlyD family secretion protein
VVAVPVQAIVREVNKEGKVVDPDAMGGGQAREGDTVTQIAREKGQEKDGVFVVDGDKAHFKPVKTGIMGETDIEVTEGIGEGQTIVTGYYKTLRNLKDDARIKTEQKGKKS